MNVGLLTIEQKNLIEGKEYTTDSLFNPIQDINDDWIISTQEIDMCTNENYQWVKDLPLIDYVPKEVNL
mgnify:CR=1 FL=1|tara:strand:+ start:369 stop:575 length:207 start_codon:yes stop_codon:yes gene_type:complete